MENEKLENELNESQAEAPADLGITDEHAEQVKGGDSFTLNFTKIKFDRQQV